MLKKSQSTYRYRLTKMQFLSLYEPHLKQSLINTQVQTLKILVWLITVQKTVKIERLAACFPLPIKYESRCRHIQRLSLIHI